MRKGKQFDATRIRALALDLDGTTLLPDASLGERTARAVGKLAARGVEIIVCTGRSPGAAARFCEALGARGPMVFFNGGALAEMPGGKRLRYSLLSPEALLEGARTAEILGAHYQAYFPQEDGRGEEILASASLSEEALEYERRVGHKVVVGDIAEMAGRHGGAVKAMFIAEPEILEKARAEMKARLGEGVYLTLTQSNYLEALSSGVSKGSGLEAALALRGIDPGQALACGDEENDLPMLAAAGFSAAPSGACEEAREMADFIFGPASDEGLAAFLEEGFGL
ncbi:MAG: HAD-IIB family hydrolase [Treponema sp.]|nr:HAD-IIB family hydrolase [Treponema sp.]